MRNTKLFEEIIREWLEAKKNFIKYSTYTYYLFEAENYLIPRLGQKHAEDITEKEIQNTVMHWQREGGRNSNPLKKSTVQNLVTITKQCIKYAVKEGYMQEYALDIHFIPA